MHSIDLSYHSVRYESRCFIQRGLLNELGYLLREHRLEPPFFIIASVHVGRLYGELLADSMKKASLPYCYIEVPDGERYKTLGTARGLYDRMLDLRLDRHSSVIALGGGVICDLAGFAAATFMRGLPHVLVPTTLLAQVDASIGGKVAVDLPRGKNLIGTFHQPRLIVSDTGLLRTLKRRQFACGVAEVIKIAMIASEELFSLLERNAPLTAADDTGLLEEIVYRAALLKSMIVMEDPYEKGKRVHLNLGHTLGHAIETACGYRSYPHGEAIAIGMIAASLLSQELHLTDASTTLRLKRILLNNGLPVSLKPVNVDLIEGALMHDKKRHGGGRFVLPLRIGEVSVSREVTMPMITRVLDALMKG